MAVSSSMDTDTMPPSQASTRRRSVAEIAQTLAGAGLMRYHSAPSSVLSSFIPNEDFFSEPIPHVGNSALTRFLSPVDELCTSISHPNALPAECFRADMRHATGVLLNTNPHLSADAGSLNRFHATTAALHQPPARCNKSQTTARHLLSSIHEHVRDCDCRISTSSIMQVDMEKHRNSESSLPEVSVPMSASSFCQSLLATTKSNLIRHSSFPANFVSGRAMEVFEEGPTSDLAGLRMQTMVESGPPDYIKAMHFQTVAKSMPQDNVRVLHGDLRETHISHDNIRGAHFSMPTTCSSFNGASNSFKVGDEGKVGDAWCLESPLSIARSPLFRQGSSPSGIVSQSSLDGTLSGCEKGLLSPSSGSSSDDDRRGKEAQYLSRMSGFWDEGGSSATTFGQRKREREIEDTIANGSHVVGTMQKGAVEEETLQWSFDGHMDMGSGGLLRMDDSVLCRARAKRGCATHPRSIAERVRRTKISEGMRKLQELVPNMEKQTNTATMLDEAVEYVKFLQQQVQKLSENQAKCNGMCNSMGNT